MPDNVKLTSVGDVTIWKADTAFCYAAGMQIDADGAPNAYHPGTSEHPQSGKPPGLDDLRNAGGPGDWFGVVTDNGQNSGTPIVQKDGDPFPGFYVSPTSLADGSRPPVDPRRYVDSTSVPYFVLPSRAVKGGPRFGDVTGATLGDVAMVFYKGQSSAAIYADVGPGAKIGEGSIALATALGLFHSVNDGHDARDVVYVVFPNTHKTPAWPRPLDELRTTAAQLFEAWGGKSRLAALFPGLIV